MASGIHEDVLVNSTSDLMGPFSAGETLTRDDSTGHGGTLASITFDQIELCQPASKLLGEVDQRGDTSDLGDEYHPHSHFSIMAGSVPPSELTYRLHEQGRTMPAQQFMPQPTREKLTSIITGAV